jgi:hypothetical protein
VPEEESIEIKKKEIKRKGNYCLKDNWKMKKRCDKKRKEEKTGKLGKKMR